MGCSFVKASHNDNNGGGGGGSTPSRPHSRKSGKSTTPEPVDLPEPPPPKPADSRLPLTVQQCFKIGKSWKGIAREMDYTGVNMFVKLFEENEDLLKLFTSFSEVKTRELQMESLELQQHASVVMSTLDEGISELGNADSFFKTLHRAGALHRKIPGFQKEFFWKIEKPFLEAVEETLGDRYTENMASIYTITIKFILETLIQGYEKGGNSQDKKDV